MNTAVLEQWLKSNGHSREWLAASLGKSLSTVTRILESKEPSKTYLLAISGVTGIPIEELQTKRVPARRKEAIGA